MPEHSVIRAVCRQAADRDLQPWWRATRDPMLHWKHALQTQFLRNAHASDTETILQLRRDAREAYYVVADR